MNNRKNLLRLLLFVSLSFVAVILNGQTVSKTFKNEALKTVLKEVEKQTGLSVIYKTDEVNENKMITATFKNASINDVLDKILDEGLIYKLQNKMIVISKSNQQKQSKSGEKKKISGTVVDEMVLLLLEPVSKLKVKRKEQLPTLMVNLFCQMCRKNRY